ncbi:MAG: glycosyltransferase [Romboutsia timonensis]|uniref:glycosyltransferase n=1 Tax=Romboutsia timonensis TaxID=1776391 RepID=UPI002A7628A3|nr:glycosyltransferase [Romboutsia timonensis]MDY3002432.1 glycosyltransferase [Romboutsia timonensis]
MKKNILFVIDSLASGGAEKSLVSLLTIFDYSKYNVDLMMFSPEGLYLPLLPKELRVLNPPEFLLNQSKGIKHLIKKRKAKDLYFRMRLSLDIRNSYLKNKFHGAQISWKWASKGITNLDKIYDVAIAYSQGMPTYYVADKVKSHKKICWVNTDYKKAPYNPVFDEGYYNKFDNIVAVSDYGKQAFLEKMPSMKSKIEVIYDIISPTLIKKMSCEEGGFDDEYDGVRILTIGRLVDVKGYDMAIEAAYKLKKDGINFRWYAIGQGSLKDKLADMTKKLGIDDKFILLGTYTNPYTYLKQCDIYVQPSRFEGFGLAIAEARILEKPIVATNFTIVHNQLKDKQNGIITEMNSESLYKGIKNLIDNEELQKHIRLNLSKENIGTEDELFKVYSLIESI